MTSNIESDKENEITKRTKRTKKIVLPGEESSSDEEINLSLSTKRPKISKFPSPPTSIDFGITEQHQLSENEQTPKQYTKYTSQTHTPQTPLASLTQPNKPVLHKPTKTPKGLFSNINDYAKPLEVDTDVGGPSSQLSSSSGRSSSSGSSTTGLALRKNQELIWEVLGEFSQKLDRIMDVLEKLEKKIDNHTVEKSVDPAENSENDFFTNFPLNKDKFKEFEEKLKEPTFRLKVVRLLLNIGSATNVKTLAANLMRRLVLDEVAEEYSLTGKNANGTTKKPFVKTGSFMLVSEICFRKFKEGEMNKVREAISDWLMQSKFRRMRREKREAERGCFHRGFSTSSEDL